MISLQEEEQDQFLFHTMTLVKKALRVIDIPTLASWTDIHKLLGREFLSALERRWLGPAVKAARFGIGKSRARIPV